MVISNLGKQKQNHFRELPYSNQIIIQCHGQFNNLLPDANLPSKRYLERLPSLHDIDLFSLNLDLNFNSNLESPLCHPIHCKYYSPHSFNQLKSERCQRSDPKTFSLIHNNIGSLKRNFEDFQTHLLNELDFPFSIIGVTETKTTNADFADFNTSLAGYNFEFVPTPLSAGGVGMYIDCDLRYTIIKKSSNEAFQALWIEIHFTNKANIICGVIYRQHNSPEQFQKYFEETIEKLSATGKVIYIMSDTNINLLNVSSCTYAQNFLFSLQSFSLIRTIDKPTRVHNNSATLIDNIFTNNVQEEIISGNIISDISDHFTQFCITRSVIEKGQTGSHLIRDYSRFSEENYLNDLSQVDWARVVPEVKTDVDKLFSRFYNKLNKLINKHAPLKPKSQNASLKCSLSHG